MLPAALDLPTRLQARRSAFSWFLDRLYADLAWAYDPASWLVSGGRWRDWQRAALPYLRRSRILEVGPGPGHFLHDLARHGFDVYAIDRSTAMWRRAGRRLESIGKPGRMVGGDARILPFADGSFDCLVYTFPTGVVREEAFWREAARVLRPGGRVVLVEGASSETRIWPGLIERCWSFLLGQGGRVRPPVEVSIDVPHHLGLIVRRVVTHGPEGTVWIIVADRGNT